MLEKTKEFYKLIKNNEKKITSNNIEKTPVTYVHIFHKEYPRLKKVELPEENKQSSLDDLFNKRRSTRKFSGKPLTLKQITSIFGSVRIIEKEGNFERRTYPSGGARFPVESYFISFNVEKLPSGAYHFNSLRNCLERLIIKDYSSIQEKIVSPFIKNASGAIILSSVISRSEVKYLYKALPFSLIEAGHIGQNISLRCAEDNIGCCAVGGYIDETISKILDLTPDEIPIYALAVGNIGKDDRKNKN